MRCIFVGSVNKACELHISGSDTGLDVPVCNTYERLFGVGRDADVYFDYPGRDLDGIEDRLCVNVFQVPDEALPLSIGAIAAGACGAGEGDGVAAVFEQLMGGVDIEVIEEVFVAVAFEMDEAAVFEDGYRLGVNGDEAGRNRLEVSYAAIFCSGDAKPWVVWEGLVGIFVPEFHEPLLISGDGVI